MKKVFVSIFLLISFVQPTLWAKDIPVPYTLEDRDRLTRLEAKLEGIDTRFDSMDKRFERLENVMMWGFGLIFSSMFILIGFILWDRRSLLAPTIRKNRELEEREDRIERVLKEYAAKNPEFREIWKKVAMF